MKCGNCGSKNFDSSQIGFALLSNDIVSVFIQCRKCLKVYFLKEVKTNDFVDSSGLISLGDLKSEM